MRKLLKPIALIAAQIAMSVLLFALRFHHKTAFSNLVVYALPAVLTAFFHVRYVWAILPDFQTRAIRGVVAIAIAGGESLLAFFLAILIIANRFGV